MLKKYLVASTLALLTLASTGLPAKADNENSNKPKTNYSQTLAPTSLTCMATAVAAREASVASAWSAFNTSMQAAFSARASALANAWTLSNNKARRDAISAAWKAFRDARNTARKVHSKAVRDAWNKFRSDAKTCKVSSSEPGGGQGYDTL